MTRISDAVLYRTLSNCELYKAYFDTFVVGRVVNIKKDMTRSKCHFKPKIVDFHSKRGRIVFKNDSFFTFKCEKGCLWSVGIYDFIEGICWNERGTH